jgi:nitrous oxide reductase
MSDERKSETRRGFLKGMLLGSGAAVVAIASGGAVAAPKPETGPAVEPKAGSQGYHETPHVRDYYKTAQF